MAAVGRFAADDSRGAGLDIARIDSHHVDERCCAAEISSFSGGKIRSLTYV
jgi:hypothetical protein